MALTLAGLKLRDNGRVLSVDLTRDAALGFRLMEMGLTPGTMVRFVGAAPLGDPLEFGLRGYRLSLRRAEAELVSVEPPEADLNSTSPGS